MESNRGIVLMKLVKTGVFSSAKIGSYCNQVSRDGVGLSEGGGDRLKTRNKAVAYIFMFLFRCSLFCGRVLSRA